MGQSREAAWRLSEKGNGQRGCIRIQNQEQTRKAWDVPRATTKKHPPRSAGEGTEKVSFREKIGTMERAPKTENPTSETGDWEKEMC